MAAVGFGTDAALDLQQRRSDGCRLAVRGRKVVGNIFDEDAFALLDMSTR